MNPGIINALNSVAVAAANAKDTNTLSALQEAACFLFRIGTAYDGTAYNTSPAAILNPSITPFNGQIFDATAAVAKQLGIPGQQLGA